MNKIHNLTLSYDDLVDIFKDRQKEITNCKPIVMSGSSSITDDGKHVYYGKLHSFNGVFADYRNVNVAEVQGGQAVECLFDSLSTFTHQWDFVGYKILINS